MRKQQPGVSDGLLEQVLLDVLGTTDVRFQPHEQERSHALRTLRRRS